MKLKTPALIALLLSITLLATLPRSAGAQGQTGNVCVRDFQPGAVCTANDVRIEDLTVVSVVEDCVSGTPGETEVVFQTLVSSAGSPDRFDIGLFLALDGGSARDGDSCYHDFLAPPLTSTPTYGDANSDGIDDLVDGPWWDGDGDTCGDLETNTQAFQTLPALRFACTDSNGDGSADVSVCTSWDNNAGSACNDVDGAFPGTNSKCSCSGVELGIAPEPAITIVKSPASQTVGSGGTASFTFTVTSRTSISNVSVSDPDCDTAPAFGGGDTNSDSILTPDETWTYTCSKTNVTADFINTVTVTGDGPLGPVTDTDSADVTVSTASMAVAKTGLFNDESSDGVAQAGETVSYSFEVTNTGTVALTNVAVSDAVSGLSAITCPSGNPIPSLGAGSSETCSATLTLDQAAVDAGQVDNTASADSDQTDPVQDSETVTLPAAPSIDLVKTGVFNDESSDGVAQAGETISYSFLVTNTGNQTLSPVAVSDPDVSAITCPSGNPIPALAPGDSETCTGSYTILAGDVTAGQKDNTAAATGQDPEGSPIEASDSETTGLPGGSPVVGVAKRVVSTTDLGGGQFDVAFQLVVENLGPLALSNVQVTDDLATTFPAPVTFTIEAGPTASGTLTANAAFDGSTDQNLLTAGSSGLGVGALATIDLTVRITLNGAVGPFSNAAVASAEGPSGSPTTDISDDGTDPDPDGDGSPGEPGEDDPTPISVSTAPDVTATKESTFDTAMHDPDGDGQVSPGDGLLYTIVVTNGGAGDALDVVFSDSPDPNTALTVGSVTTSKGTVVTGNAIGDTTVVVDLGSLTAGGGAATVTYEVTIDDPLASGVTSLVNQGVVSGSNIPNTPTDDPSTVEDDDPTLVDLVISPTEIPTLSEWALALFCLLLLASAGRFLAR